MKNDSILIIAGQGGHIEQARRLVGYIEIDIKESSKIILLTDFELKDNGMFDVVYSVKTCAPKERDSTLKDILDYSLQMAFVLFKLSKEYNIHTVLVTGPGYAVIPSIYYRIRGKLLIVFESWSRFEQKSKCGKILYKVAQKFYVQHEDLLKLYPKATWVGLL